MVSSHREDDGLPHWDGSSMHIGTAAQATMSDGSIHAARGIYLWDPDDPLTVSFHTQIAMQSEPVTHERYPAVPEDQWVLCWVCEEPFAWNDMGMILPCPESPHGQSLHCMDCGMDHDSAEIEEAMWVMSLDSVEGACLVDPLEPAPAGAPIRIWRASENDVTFAFTQGANTVFITVPINRIDALLGAIKEFSFKTPYEDNYLAGGLAALEKLANGKSS